MGESAYLKTTCLNVAKKLNVKMNPESCQKMVCPKCKGAIEYPVNISGQTWPCPICGENIFLPYGTKPNRNRIFMWGMLIAIAFAGVVGVAFVFIMVKGTNKARNEIVSSQQRSLSGNPSPQTFSIEDIKSKAEKGDAGAQFNLGFCYAIGQGVAKDEAEAVKWYRKAAEQNNADAQFYLGLCYANGRGVAKDEVEAVNWYRKASEQNNATAQYNAIAQYYLGICYANGQGVAKDEVIARSWYELSAKNGNIQASAALAAFSPNKPPVSIPIVSSTLATERPAITVVSTSAKVVETNGGYWGWSWKLVLKNNTPSPVQLYAHVKFFDKDGYEINEAIARDIYLFANEQKIVTGVRDISPPQARSITSVKGSVDIQ